MPNLSEQQSNRLKKQAAAASILLAITLIIIKTIGVFMSGSLSVLSSMIDSMADLFASCITFWAVRASSLPADEHHRYGHGKAEALSALVQAAFITGSGLFIMYDGIDRLLNPHPLPDIGSGIIVMSASLFLTIILIAFQKYVSFRTKSKAISADAAHYSVDVLTNISIILTLAIVSVFQIEWFDSLTALIISAYLLHNSYHLAYDAIAKIALSCDHILGLHDMRTHDLGNRYMIEMHLELDGDLSLSEAHQYTDQVEAELQKVYPQAQIIIHQDPAGLHENRLDYTLLKHS